VDSLPPQPLGDLPIPTRKTHYEQLGRLCAALSMGITAEETLAEMAGFHSTEVMRISLQNWGLLTLLPVRQDEIKRSQPPLEKRSEPTERKPLPGDGKDTKELPPLTRASALFQNAIATLSTYLGQITYFKEVLRDGRFELTDEVPKEADTHPDVYIRSQYSADVWKKLCDEHGEDPESTYFEVYNEKTWARGITYYPEWGITCLIVAVLMTRGGSEAFRLLEEIHLEPNDATRRQLIRLLVGRPEKGDGLYPIARKLARLMRGGEVSPGRNSPPLNSLKHALGLSIRDGLQQGISREELASRLEISKLELSWYEEFFPPEPQSADESNPGI
jgi:hypothetical protein